MHSYFIQTAATDVLVGTYSTVHKHNFSAHDAKAHNNPAQRICQLQWKGIEYALLPIY